MVSNKIAIVQKTFYKGGFNTNEKVMIVFV